MSHLHGRLRGRAAWSARSSGVYARLGLHVMLWIFIPLRLPVDLAAGQGHSREHMWARASVVQLPYLPQQSAGAHPESYAAGSEAIGVSNGARCSSTARPSSALACGGNPRTARAPRRRPFTALAAVRSGAVVDGLAMRRGHAPLRRHSWCACRPPNDPVRRWPRVRARRPCARHVRPNAG